MKLLSGFKISKEIKVGFAFVVAISVLVWGVMYLKGLELFKTKRNFYAVYDHVNGLVPANPVMIKGMKVGQVKSLYFSKRQVGKIIVELTVESDYPIPRNSIARILSADLMGSKVVDIELGDSTVMLASGDTIKAVTESTLGEEVNKQLLPLKRKAENLISSIDTIATIVQEVLNRNTRDNLVQAVENVKNALQNLAHMTYNIDTLVESQRSNLKGIISNVESISRNLKQNNDKINNILTNFSEISDSLAKAKIPTTFAIINRTLNDLNTTIEKINKGQGTVGLLLNNDQLYNEVTKAAKELNLLLEDIKANPKKYVKVSVF